MNTWTRLSTIFCLLGATLCGQQTSGHSGVTSEAPLCSFGVGCPKLIIESTSTLRPIRSETGLNRFATRWSSLALVAASAADVASSYHRPERNPVMRNHVGEVGAKAVALKSAIVLLVLGSHRLIGRRHPKLRRHLAWTRLGLAGLYLGASIHNVTHD